MHGSEKESGPSPLENLNFLNLHVMFLNISIVFRKNIYCMRGTGVRGVQTFSPENSNLLGLHSKITERKNQGPLTHEFLSTKRAKYSFHFLTCLKTKLHVHVTIEGILSIINFLYECQCKCGCMEKVATWSVHYSFRYTYISV